MTPAGTSLSGSGIPLGATELDSAGVSPLFTAPTSSLGGGTLGCAGSTMAGSTTGSTPGCHDRLDEYRRIVRLLRTMRTTCASE